jgi:hypothetical protein
MEIIDHNKIITNITQYAFIEPIVIVGRASSKKKPGQMDGGNAIQDDNMEDLRITL